MRSNIDFIQGRMALNLAESGTDITLGWTDYGSVTIDPVTQARTGTPVARLLTVKGLLHFVPPTGSSQVRLFNEMEVGDCIVDLHGDVALDGKEGLSFTINGERWKPKKIGDKLARSWDVVQRGQRLYRSVLLSKAT